MDQNSVVVDGRLSESEPLRHTPAGVPILKAVLSHASEQIEAGGPRKVELDLPVVAVEENARYLAAAPLGARIRAKGFLAAKGRSNRQLVLHITDLEFPGEQDGIR